MRITSLPYNKNSTELFSRIAHRPYAVFLDSAHPHYPDTRFDIISAEPTRTVTASDEDPFTRCKNSLMQYQTDLPDNLPELPFTIGAIGYFSYDVGRRLEKIPVIAEDDIDLPNTCIGFYDWSIVVDHYQKKTWLITLSVNQENKVRHWLNEKPSYADFSITQAFETNMPMSRYEKAFNELQQHIQDGDCYEANLCQRFSGQYQGAPWKAYELLREKSPAPYSVFFNLGKSAILSFSPERFISLQNRKAETKPIKGTRPRSDEPRQDQHNAYELIHSEKDKAENLMIVDLLRNDFGKCCVPGSIHVPALFSLESFRNVHHLVSTVTGTLEANQHAFDLLRHCFPGGSITGVPKVSAMKIIEKLEPHRRSIYCGTIGYIDIRGNMDCKIAIRTKICDGKNIYCYAGGAIVSDSVCEEEYQESLDKVNNLLNAIQA